ncbi:MAG: hypothetical protein ACE1ZG_07550 [Gammaproteobacteria bacterium]
MVYRDMSEKTRIQFRRSEIVEKDTIYAAAPEIYAALIGQGLVNDDNYKEIMKKSVNQAIDLALVTDMVVATAGDRDQSF